MRNNTVKNRENPCNYWVYSEWDYVFSPNII